MEDGNWWIHPDTNRTWTNYTFCLDPVDINFRRTVSQITVTGLSVSLVSLLISLLILFAFPALKCARNTIHINTFLSVAINNIAWLLWYYFVLFSPSVWSQNSVWCRLLQIFTTYFMLTTYFWMLCEGTFLRMIAVRTFIKEEFWVCCLLVLGWLVPGVVLVPYVVYRYQYEDELCWMSMDGQSMIFLAVPVITVIIINIYFLCSVVKVLRHKLRFENNFNRKNDVTFKSAKAVLILIPIFGLHFLLMPMRPESGSTLEYVYEVVSSITTSTQGLAVSFLLCFCNNDVMRQIKVTFLRQGRRGSRHSRNNALRITGQKVSSCLRSFR